MKPNKDIPIELLIPYIVKERDKYKEKLDSLIKYAKSLERYAKYLEGRNKKLEKSNKELNDWLLHLRDE